MVAAPKLDLARRAAGSSTVPYCALGFGIAQLALSPPFPPSFPFSFAAFSASASSFLMKATY